MQPDAVLLTGSVGCGKTEAAIDAILDERQFAAFSPIWVLLATGQQIHAFRDRLLARSADQVQFGVEFFDFYDLYARLLDLAGNPQRLVEDTTRYQILRHVISGLDLEFFTPIAHTPGFIGLTAGLIHEFKQGLVDPARFSAIARTPKDRDLARIYAAYQDFLQGARLVDRHGAGWLAIEHLQQNPALAEHVSLLVVDGFDQFNGVHLRLLTELAAQVQHAVLTLTHVPGLKRFRRFAQTHQRIVSAAPNLWRERPVQSSCDRSSPALDHLVQSLFDSRSPAVPSDGSVSFIEAPDVLRETQAVLRRIKRLLLDGTPPEAITILARRLFPYSGALRETAQAYGVPLVVREGLPLRDNPAVSMLLTLIDLAARDFPRRDVLDTLRCPYLTAPDLTADQIAQLSLLSIKYQVVRGRDLWLDAVESSVFAREDEDHDPAEPLPVNTAETLYQSLDAHFARITPPARGTIYELVGWIEQLIGPDPAAAQQDQADSVDASALNPLLAPHFNLLGNIRAAADPTRDILSMQAFRRVLANLRAAHDLLCADGCLEEIEWDVFRAELQLAVDRAQVSPPGGRSRIGRVLATDVMEARGLPHDHVFILGLSEGVFPAPESEDALYWESDRLQMEAQGIDLQTANERADDMSLFYQALGLARQSLTLTRFTVDDKGNFCPPSPYWTAVHSLITDPPLERIPLGAAPRLDDCATVDEAAVAVAAVLSGEHPAHEGVAAVYNALLEYPAWANVRRGRAIEAAREDSARPFDAYSGRLSTPDLIDLTARALGPDRKWSAPQLNQLGTCGFRFFASRLLHLESLKEPEEGPDIMQIGSINHEILEKTYTRIADADLALTANNWPHAQKILIEVAEAVFAQAPRKHGFRPTPLWDQECATMRRRLEWLVRHDFEDFTPLKLTGERRPFWQEAEFGRHGQPFLVIDGEAGPVLVRGQIDRMDRIENQIIIMDYKTGTTGHPTKDMESGRDVQMMIYMLAAQELLARHNLPYELAGGLFWHIRSRKTSGDIHAGDPAIETARQVLHHNILRARQGDFAVHPTNGQCASYCEFGPLCRVSRAYHHKP